jgi:APA family basic amino acid/polyamine antiporter
MTGKIAEGIEHPEPRSRMLGRWMSAAMVVGTMIGSGIYLLPTTVSPYGPNLVIAFIVTGAGTMCIAFALARLAANIPGGPFVYIRRAFGDTAAFLTMWSYMVSQWTGIAATAVAVAGAIGHVFPQVAEGPGLIAVAMGSIAVLTLINLRGARSTGGLQVIATLIKTLPLVAVLVLVMLRAGGGGQLEPLTPAPIGASAIATAGALMLFSMTGFEAAVIAANVTRDSQRTVPLATIAGTGFTAIIYLFATVAVLMLLPSALAANSTAPFADAISTVLGGAAGIAVALVFAVSSFGTCGAVLLLAAEVGRSLAGASDLPSVFGRTNDVGAPIGGLLIGAAIAGLLVLASSSKSFVSLYVLITLVSTVSTLVLYLACTAAALKIGVMRRWMALAVIAVLFSLAMFVGAGLEATLWGFALAIAGLPIRFISRWLSKRAAVPAAS